MFCLISSRKASWTLDDKRELGTMLVSPRKVCTYAISTAKYLHYIGIKHDFIALQK